MHLQAAVLFAKEIGTFFALTTWNLINSISQRRHNTKTLKISAMHLSTMLFLSISIIKVKNLETLSL